MSKKIALILCLALFIPLVTGCGESLKFWKKKSEVEVVNKKLPPFEQLFNRTVEMYNAKQYKDAIQAFLFLRENYPRKGSYQARITLYIADSHYKLKEYPEAIANYEEFIKLYPTSPDVPYATFQIGMSYYKQRRTYDRDATFVRKAITYFEKVLRISPPGVLVNESIRMIAFCQRELSLHEFFIADFYLRTHHYKAAILRFKGILRKFYSLKVQDRAHLGIAKAYLKLKNRNAAYRHLSFVAKHYPQTPYGKEAWKLLQKDYKVAALKDLPNVTFPRKMPAETVQDIETTSEKKAIHKTSEETAAPEKEKKEAAPASKPAAVKVAKKAPAPAPKVYYPPVGKTVKVKKEKSMPEEKTSTPAPAAKEVTKTATKPAPEKPVTVQPKAEKPVAQINKTRESEEVTAEKEAPAPPKAEVKAKPAAAPAPPAEVVKKTKVKSPPPAPEKGKASTQALHKAPETKPSKVAKAEKETPKVKTLVKTDRLPPKGRKAAGDNSLGPVGAIDTRLPIHIASDHVEAQQGKNSVRFYGNVVVTQKDVTMKCDDLTAFYVAGGKAIDRIIAHGNVSISQRDKKVMCGRAVFYNAARKIVLEKSPTAWDGKNKLSGNKMVLLLDKNEIQILGSRKKPTELVIYPEK